MKRIKLTSNLYLDEYIPKELYLKHIGKEHRLISLLNEDLILGDQMLRNKFGIITINNWWDGGSYNQSGIRTIDAPEYSETSQHPYGNASDKKFKTASAEEVREYIKLHWRVLKIACIENGVSWVHSDCRWWRQDKLLIV